jgi:hypothetical protein
MTLRQAIASFLDHARQSESIVEVSLETCAHALELLTTYFSPDINLAEITTATLRDFLKRWYVEHAGSRSSEMTTAESALPAALTNESEEASRNPGPQALCDSLREFFRWAQDNAELNKAEEYMRLLEDARESLPRALEITALLSHALAERGGAFAFPEFLTSFEEGGHSQYDLDTPGEVAAIEGYFRIIQVKGAMVEAEEIISDERVWPIIFPPGVASRLMSDYIINLELVRKDEGWHVAACGFAYPPGTDL